MRVHDNTEPRPCAGDFILEQAVNHPPGNEITNARNLHCVLSSRLVTLVPMAILVGMVSQKGGVGKTTLTANLAAALNNDGRVVCVDLDPQNALRLHLGVQMDEMDGLTRCTLEGRTWNTSLFQSPGSPEVLPYGTINETDRDTLEVFLAENPNWLSSGLATLGVGNVSSV